MPQLITEETQYILCNINSSFEGNDCTAYRDEVIQIFVGDAKTIENKKKILWERVQERAMIWYDVGFETM